MNGLDGYIIAETVVKQGLAVALGLGVFGLCAWLVKHIATNLTKSIDRQIEAIENLKAGIAEHEKEAAIRSNYIRQEHEQMIDALGRINGYKND